MLQIYRIIKKRNITYIFSKKEVNALVQAINFLVTRMFVFFILLRVFYQQKISDIHFPGLFRIQDNRNNVIQIVKKLSKGDPQLFHFLYENCTPLDCSNALNQYLLKRKPLLPPRIQSLISASNDGVTIKTIALDALGLVFDEFKNSTNFVVIYKLLDMMKALIMRGSQRPTETRVCYGPFVLLPILFDQNVRT